MKSGRLLTGLLKEGEAWGSRKEYCEGNRAYLSNSSSGLTQRKDSAALHAGGGKKGPR